jgi:hypothetical protein
MSEGKRLHDRTTGRFDDNIKIKQKEKTRLSTGFIRLNISVNGGLL